MKIFHKIPRIKQTGVNCGPNCLAQLLHFFGKNFTPEKIIQVTKMVTDLGTFDGELGVTAIKLGFKTRITTHNLYVFDPTWEKLPKAKLIKNLSHAEKKTKNTILKKSIQGYKNYLSKGGTLRFDPISKELLIKKLQKYPLIVGLASTYLYGQPRPKNERMRYGHFVVVNGYDSRSDSFNCTDPWYAIPFSKTGRYRVKADKLITAIYLGEGTYDCTVLEIWN